MKKLSLLVASGALAFSSAAFSAGVIDLFDVADAVEDNTNGAFLFSATGGVPLVNNGDSSSADGLSILGGQRDIHVNQVANDFAATGVAIDVGSGFLSYSEDSGVEGRGVIQWDGDDLGASTLDSDGLGGVDLTLLGQAFQLEVVATDLGFQFDIYLFTDDNNWSRIGIAASGAGIEVIPFAAFLACGAPLPGIVGTVECAGGVNSVDLMDLGAIQAVINVNGAADIDFTIGPILTVPEPATLGLLGLGLLGMASVGRRRKAA